MDARSELDPQHAHARAVRPVTSRQPFRRHQRESADDTLVRIVAGIVVAAMVFGGVRWFRAAQAAEAAAAANAQVQQQAYLAGQATQRAEQMRLSQAHAERARQAEAAAQPAMYKCRDAAGVVAIQNWPCAPDAQAEWARPYHPGDAREAAEARQRSANQARNEAAVAHYSRIYGDAAAPAVMGGSPASTFDNARCENARRFRDSEYRRLGNRRTYAIIRQLDDYVYEACKRT
jgi:hypothetical protein